MSANDEDTPPTPTSPPPSFRSRGSSPSRHHVAPVDQNLADTFGDDGSDDEDNDGDDRQRLMRGNPSSSTERLHEATSDDRPTAQRTVTAVPTFVPPTGGRVYGGGSGSDGVFANLSAKPERGEKQEEHPPVCVHIVVL